MTREWADADLFRRDRVVVRLSHHVRCAAMPSRCVHPAEAVGRTVGDVDSLLRVKRRTKNEQDCCA